MCGTAWVEGMPVSCCTIALKLDMSAESTAMGAFLLTRARRLLTLVTFTPVDVGEDKPTGEADAEAAAEFRIELIHGKVFSSKGFRFGFAERLKPPWKA